MSFALIVTLVVTFVAIALFVSERLPLALTSVLVLTSLVVTGVVPVDRAFDGFSNPATVAIAAMFVLSEGLRRTGAIAWLGDWLGEQLRASRTRGLLLLMVGTAVASAFVNNTAVVVILLPILSQCARDAKVSPTRLLIPLSFASMFGGTCTLVGTSTNLLVSSLARDAGLAPFGMFELAPVGLVLSAVGVLYLLVVGRRLLPRREAPRDLQTSFDVASYVTDVTLGPRAPSVGERIADSPLAEMDLDVIAVFRGGEEKALPADDLVLEAGDVVRMRIGLAELASIDEREVLHIATADPHRHEAGTGETQLVEAVVAPGSRLVDATIREVGFRDAFGAVVLAVRQGGELERDALPRLRLRAGDALLLEIDRERLAELRRSTDFVVVSQVALSPQRSERWWVAVGLLVAAVGVAAAGLLPIAATATAGAVLMVLTGCLRLDEALEAIDLRVLMLLGGVLPLGYAIEDTGAAGMLADALGATHAFGGLPAIVSTLFVVTVALTAFMSNNGTAVLLTPVALALSEQLGVGARPLLMAVTFGASTCFVTPVGYQTNALVYGAGDYRFTDFVRVGGPLTLAFAALVAALVPWLWPG